MTQTDTHPHPASPHPGARPQHAVAAPSAVDSDLSRVELLRALTFGLLAIVVAGAVGWAVLFWGGAGASDIRPAFYMLGLGGAAFAGIMTVWLHGRLASLQSGQGAAVTGRLVAARMQALLASGFAVKLGVLVVGFFGLRRITIGGVPTKFTDVATFAVTFAAAALLCQLTTAALMARSMRRGRGPALVAHPDAHPDAN